MNPIVKFFCRFGKTKHTPIAESPKTPLLHISDFDNLYNQLALELARPHLQLGQKVDEKKVYLLRQQLDELVCRELGTLNYQI